MWAAAWLYRATDDEYYLKYVVDNAVYMSGTGWAVKEFSWDNKYAGVQILLSKVVWYSIKQNCKILIKLIKYSNSREIKKI